MGDAIEPVQANRGLAEHRGHYRVWIRRMSMSVLAAVTILALFNVVGQRATGAQAHTEFADLTVHSPATVRPGLLFQAKISVTARQTLSAAQLVLGSGWIDGLTLNTEEPGASTETSGPNGSLVLRLGPLNAAQTFTQYLDFQVNPTSVSRRDLTVAVKSKGIVVVGLRREMTIVP